jgi:hypothetical protein
VCRVSLQVADFGMSADDDDAAATDVGGTNSAKKATWKGTYLYMAPVCLPRVQVHVSLARISSQL